MHNQAIQDFLKFLDEWEEKFPGPRKEFPVTNQTLIGLRVTLKAALLLIERLHEQSGFQYLLTARLNQDALEVEISAHIECVRIMFFEFFNTFLYFSISLV